MAYNITGFNLDTSHVLVSGTRRNINIVGDPHATFTLTIHTDDTTALYYNWQTGRFTTTFNRLVWQKIGANGTFNSNITFPPETANTIYSVQLMAEPHFDTKLEISDVLSPVISIKKIYQYINKKITFTSSSDSHASDYVLPTNVEISGPPSFVTIDDVKTLSAGKGNIKGSISWTYSLRENRFIITKQPSVSDFKSRITKVTTSDTAAYAETEVEYSTKVKLDDIDGLAVGMKITGVSSGSLSGTPSITAIDSDNCSSTYKVITFDSTQTFASGITLTFTGYGDSAIDTMHGSLFQLNNFKVVLNSFNTTTTSTVSNSTTVPVTSISGIKPKSTGKKVATSVTAGHDVVMTDDISDLGVGQVLVSVNNDDTITSTATIKRVDVNNKKITFDEPVTLTAGGEVVFASTFFDSVNSCSTSKPYVDSISGFNLITNKEVTLDDSETLTFSGSSSNSATITADVVVAKMGENDITVTLQLDNILKVS